MKRDLQVILREWGRMGGAARTKALSPERRSELARRAARARWAKYRATKKASAA